MLSKVRESLTDLVLKICYSMIKVCCRPPHHKICIAQSVTPEHTELVATIDDLVAAAKSLNLPEIKANLQLLVPEYAPAGNKPRAKVIPHSVTAVHQ